MSEDGETWREERERREERETGKEKRKRIPRYEGVLRQKCERGNVKRGRSRS